MLDWLKPILGDAHTDEIEKKVEEEIGRHFVTRADFNAKAESVKQLEKTIGERDAQLETLKKSTGDVSALQQQIADLQAQNAQNKKQYEADLMQMRVNSAVEAALTTAGAKNITAAKALLADFLTDATLADDGTVKGLTAEIEALSKAEGTAFLFEPSKSASQSFKGMQPGNPGGNNPPADANTYEARLAEARKTGNTAAAVAIKREAADNGVFLM